MPIPVSAKKQQNWKSLQQPLLHKSVYTPICTSKFGVMYVKSMSRVGQGFAHLYEYLYYRYTLLPSSDLQCGMMTSQYAAKSITSLLMHHA